MTEYTYDKNNRVTRIVYPKEGTNRLLWDEYFQYDSLGRMVARNLGTEPVL